MQGTPPAYTPQRFYEEGLDSEQDVQHLTSLDPKESEGNSNGCLCPSSMDGHCSCNQIFRHSGWKTTRHRVYAALKRTDASEATLQRFEECGSNAWVVENPERHGEYRVASTRCKSRWCVPCAAQRSRLICGALRKQIKGRSVRFLTLTLGGNATDLKAAINKLYTSFRLLRKQKAWKASVVGGVAMLEVKPGKTLERWNPHLHCIIEGRYIAQQTLVKLWKQITGDSYIVDIRLIRSQDGIARYVTKYVTKPVDANLMRMENKLVEAMEALKGRKIAATFGSWRHLQLTAADTEREWKPIAPLHRLIHRAAAGERFASSVLDALRRRMHSWQENSPKQDPTRAGPSNPGDSSSTSEKLRRVPSAETV